MGSDFKVWYYITLSLAHVENEETSRSQLLRYLKQSTLFSSLDRTMC